MEIESCRKVQHYSNSCVFAWDSRGNLHTLHCGISQPAITIHPSSDPHSGRRKLKHRRQLFTKCIRRTFGLLFSRPIVAGDSQYCCCSRRWEAVGKKTTEMGNRGANCLAFINTKASPSLFRLSFTSSNEQKTSSAQPCALERNLFQFSSSRQFQ